MTEFPESTPTIESARQAIITPESPGSFAWKAFRAIARFTGSVFFPFFRVWGETEIIKGPQVFIVRNYGILTWLCVLRIFKRPLRFVIADVDEKSRWYSLAESGGLAPICLNGNSDEDCSTLRQLIEAGEKLVLVVPAVKNAVADMLVARLKSMRSLRLLFMAISGASEALPPGAIIPRVVPVSVFCGLPHYTAQAGDPAQIELDFLEHALNDLAIDELPSLFANHPRNVSNF